MDEKARADAFKTINRIRFNGEQNRQAEELAKALETKENPPKLKNYRLVSKEGSYYPISKTAYDYAQERIRTKALEAAGDIEMELQRQKDSTLGFLRDNVVITRKGLLTQEYQTKDGVMSVKERRVGGGFSQGKTVSDVFKSGVLVKEGVSVEEAYSDVHRYLKLSLKLPFPNKSQTLIGLNIKPFQDGTI